MKSIKGQVDYLGEIKKQELSQSIIQWLVVVVLFIIGFFVFPSPINIFNMVAMGVAYLALRSTAKVLLKKDYKPMDSELLFQLDSASEHMSIVYHPILASRDRIMGFECFAISGNTILGYSSYRDTDMEFATRFIRTILAKRKVDSVNIKLFNEFKPFMDRVEGLQNMLTIAPTNDEELEQMIEAILLKHSM